MGDIDTTVKYTCAQCKQEFKFLVTQWQAEHLLAGDDPHKIISEEFGEHIILMATGLCKTCWIEMEREFIKA